MRVTRSTATLRYNRAISKSITMGSTKKRKSRQKKQKSFSPSQSPPTKKDNIDIKTFNDNDTKPPITPTPLKSEDDDTSDISGTSPLKELHHEFEQVAEDLNTQFENSKKTDERELESKETHDAESCIKQQEGGQSKLESFGFIPPKTNNDSNGSTFQPASSVANINDKSTGYESNLSVISKEMEYDTQIDDEANNDNYHKHGLQYITSEKAKEVSDDNGTVNGLKIRLIKVEDGTFQQMDKKYQQDVLDGKIYSPGANDDNSFQMEDDNEHIYKELDETDTPPIKKKAVNFTPTVQQFSFGNIKQDVAPTILPIDDTRKPVTRKKRYAKTPFFSLAPFFSITEWTKEHSKQFKLQQAKKEKAKSKTRSKKTKSISAKQSPPPPPSSFTSQTQEDDIDTVASAETGVHELDESKTNEVPPEHTRYRLGMILDKVDLNVTNTQTSQDELAPAERYRQVFISLQQFIKTFDSDALFVSWTNTTSFSILRCNEEEFPTEMEQIATFFDGFRARLKAGYKCFFRFCLHTPKWSATWTEMKLASWAESRGYQLFRCNIQTENSTTIGWMVYSLSYTNVDALKTFLMSKTSHEWGFQLGSPTQTDKNLEWKHRLKALQVMVPADKEESARSTISKLFSPHTKQGTFKTFEDCYLYVSNEHENKSKQLAMFFAEMLGRQRFHVTLSKNYFVRSIIKDIDKKVATESNMIMTIWEMILNLPATERQVVKTPGPLFLAIDFVPDASKIWHNNVKSKDAGSGYYLTFYTWNEGEATTTAKGLGRFLAHYHGFDIVHPFFSADHWDGSSQWVWNEERNTFDTPEQLHMAANVLFDPNSEAIKEYNEQMARENEMKAKESKTKPAPRKSAMKATDDNKASEVDKLKEKADDQSPLPNDDQLSKDISEHAFNMALSIHSQTNSSPSSSSEESSLSDDEDSPPLTNNEHNHHPPFTHEQKLDELNQKLAMEMVEKAADPELSSLPEIDGKTSNVNTIFASDIKSVSSDVTDLTDNTVNAKYHNEEASLNSSTSSLVSTSSIQSVSEEDIQRMLDEGCTWEEIENNMQLKAAHMKLKAGQKGDRLIAITLRKKREALESAAQHEHTSTHQSGSNCDTASQL